jgi:hypothetical protein
MSPSPSEIPAPLVHIVASISALINLLSTAFHKIPGSPIIIRYIRSSYQNDPWRSLLEVLLVAFALRTVLKGRTRGDGQSKSFIKFSNKVCCPSVIERSETDENVTLCRARPEQLFMGQMGRTISRGDEGTRFARRFIGERELIIRK